MLFSDALVQLKAQMPVYRSGWVPQDGYICLMPGMTHVWKVVLMPAPNAGNYIFSMADFLADDWEVYTGSKDIIDEANAV
jgi:Protein of unknown function (DUF2829)